MTEGFVATKAGAGQLTSMTWDTSIDWPWHWQVKASALPYKSRNDWGFCSHQTRGRTTEQRTWLLQVGESAITDKSPTQVMCCDIQKIRQETWLFPIINAGKCNCSGGPSPSQIVHQVVGQSYPSIYQDVKTLFASPEEMQNVSLAKEISELHVPIVFKKQCKKRQTTGNMSVGSFDIKVLMTRMVAP